MHDERYRAPSELELESYSDVLRESCTKAVKMLYKEPVVLFFSLWIRSVMASGSNSVIGCSLTCS